ncbi:polysaccharide biosynthesis protein [Paenibacillus frigoriresistens]|uniref:UDP-N-acetylglucosamine 4,6-dehydratase family protein n=1 Tax=Paenibacillus alginolyticus TaxID=59839 RepID=UPI00156436D4|nr:UDP-N-acetylglucosamine 4,6-dehydratase family protein [Paenibacillus frigoriresistens]NRF93663.1 polysaccharide biosynthesis protein [Paenibacillus frigoriresistens]
MNGIFTGKKVLITGGTGTIGSQLLKHILLDNPAIVRIFSRDEHKQFELQQQFREHSNIRYLIGDVRDYTRVLRALEDIDYVFHTAAMKHVPSCEYNPFEAVQTNVIGTQNIIQSALYNGVKKVLFTSTDKAISPTNTYGATKLTAERLVSAAQTQKGPKETIFTSVRFGNVMGSRGSVIPLFKQQILEKGFITVTDINMIRYMMTPQQAISLMLKACDMAQGGEVFVLKMPIIRLIDLIEVMIEELTEKYSLKNQPSVRVIGLRPGEKMYEELMSDDEVKIAYESDDMYIIPSSFMEGRHEYPLLSDQHQTTYKNVQLEQPISKEVLRNWMLEENLV